MPNMCFAKSYCEEIEEKDPQKCWAFCLLFLIISHMQILGQSIIYEHRIWYIIWWGLILSMHSPRPISHCSNTSSSSFRPASKLCLLLLLWNTATKGNSVCAWLMHSYTTKTHFDISFQVIDMDFFLTLEFRFIEVWKKRESVFNKYTLSILYCLYCLIKKGVFALLYLSSFSF